MLPEIADPDRQFAARYVPRAHLASVQAVWSFDEVLGQTVAGARDLFVGQMRLTWWHDAVSTPRAGRRHPVLDALSAAGVKPRSLAAMVEGWEVLLEPLPLGEAVLSTYATARGGTLFGLTASLLGVAPITAAAGEGWALADFSRRCSDRDTAARAWSLARERLTARPPGLPRPLRILARLARADALLGAPVERTGWRMLRAAW